MQAAKQITIKEPIYMEGIGVHSGESCRILIKPAPIDFGIIYTTNENDKKTFVAADYKNVSDTTMCTRITNEYGVTVSVIEHISAAFYSLGVTNALVVLEEGDEIPFADGSARAFVELLQKCGLQKQGKDRKYLRIIKGVKVGDEKRWASLIPCDHFIVNAICDFSARGLITQPFAYDSAKHLFVDEIADARTFGFYSDVEYLRKNNLAFGASLNNTVVFDDKGKPIEGCELRYENEPVRHKILDAIGDLSLCRYQIIGRYDSFCPGHGINNILLRELFKDSGYYKFL